MDSELPENDYHKSEIRNALTPLLHLCENGLQGKPIDREDYLDGIDAVARIIAMIEQIRA